MSKNINLLKGSILPSLTKLALPIMATSLIQMAYNMIDMIWIGRLSSNAVAAVGAAGMYMWLSNGLAALGRMGGQVKVGHSFGAGAYQTASDYAKAALQLGIFFGIAYGLASIIFHVPLIGFFKLSSPQVVSDAQVYLIITCGAVLFSFLNQIFSGIMTAMGNSKNSLIATTVGLALNLVLDPVLIFGLGPFPYLGVAGAAIATVLAQAVVTLVFLIFALKDTVIFQKIHILSRPSKRHMSEIIRIGLPTSIQSMIFTGISMIIARLIAGFGDTAVAVQKVGSQIESISWMTADGFAAAVNSFVAQNFGSGNITRVKKGYAVSMGAVTVWGILCTLILICLPGPIFQVFIPDKNVLDMGIDYLQILGISQLFMCIEIATAGAFSGLGKTIPPSVVGIILTSARIPLALLLAGTALGLNGIWWSITISSTLKGIALFIWFIRYQRRIQKPLQTI